MKPEDLVSILIGRRFGQGGRGRAVREQAGLSLREVASAVGTDIASLSRWERGEVRPRGLAAARWAAVLTEVERTLKEAESVEELPALDDAIARTFPHDGASDEELLSSAREGPP